MARWGAQELADSLAGEWAGWAHQDTQELPRGWGRGWLAQMGIDPSPPWSHDFALGEVVSLGRASARAMLAHTAKRTKRWELRLLSKACRLSLHSVQDSHGFEVVLRLLTPKVAPLWPALARHLARRSTPADRALLIDLAQYPEKREPPLSWGLQFIVRGDILLDDGSVLTLDELTDEAGLSSLPYLEDVPAEL